MERKLNFKHVVDAKGNRHEVDKVIGEGAQGVVLRLKDGKYIAKLVRKDLETTAKESWIDFLSTIDIDKERFAKPTIKVVQPRLGYLAEFASGMEKMEVLRTYKALSGERFLKWFKESGGLLRRIAVLRNLAQSLQYLHSKGLIYADLSLNNIYISEKGRGDKVFLIDTDNISYKSSVLNSIHTPFYGAPELVRFRQPNSVYSDCYSFAVIAYELLTQAHPLIGEYVNNGEPDMEEKALRGELPWVDHFADRLNERKTGINSEKVMPAELFKLFRITFEEGLNNPEKRPSMAKWFEELSSASNYLLKCAEPDCVDFYIHRGVGCPFCGSKPKHLVKVKFWRWDEEFSADATMLPGNKDGNNLMEELLLDELTHKSVRARHFLLTNKEVGPDSKLLNIKIANSEVDSAQFEFERLLDFDVLATSLKSGVKTIKFLTSENIKNSGRRKTGESITGFLHLKPLSEPQRVMTIEIDEQA